MREIIETNTGVILAIGIRQDAKGKEINESGKIGGANAKGNKKTGG